MSTQAVPASPRPAIRTVGPRRLVELLRGQVVAVESARRAIDGLPDEAPDEELNVLVRRLGDEEEALVALIRALAGSTSRPAPEVDAAAVVDGVMYLVRRLESGETRESLEIVRVPADRVFAV